MCPSWATAPISRCFLFLKKKEGKDIWLIGGGEVNTLLQNLELIDEYLVFVMPIILGAGVPLFAAHPNKMDLILAENKVFESGVVFLHYIKP
jgi:dihydrofolate reductase